MPHPSKKNKILKDDNQNNNPDETKQETMANEANNEETPTSETENQNEQPVIEQVEQQQENAGDNEPIIESESNNEPTIEILSDEELIQKSNPAKEFTPYDKNRVERSYASQSTEGQKQVVERVAEDVISTDTPPTQNVDGGSGSNKKSTTSSSSNAAKPEPANPEMATLSPTEQKEASTMLVDAILGGYRQLWGGAEWAVSVSEDKVLGWIMNDDLSDDLEIPYGVGEKVGVREFYQEFNKAVEEAAKIPDNHFDRVRESMIREFTRRGWGISDMQNIMQFFARDFAQRAGNFYALYKQQKTNTNQLFEVWRQQKEILEKMKKQEEEGKNKNTPEGAQA